MNLWHCAHDLIEDDLAPHCGTEHTSRIWTSPSVDEKLVPLASDVIDILIAGKR